MNKPVAKYLQSKDMWENRWWRRLVSGLFVTEVEGKLMAEDEFAIRFPKFNPVHLRLNPHNADRTRNYLL